MRAKSGTVDSLWVYAHDLPPTGIRLDRPAWFVWLDATTTTRFSYPLVDPCCGYSIGFMTVRKETRQRGGQYWSVYRRQGRRLRKIYLGASRTVTRARLEEVVATLLRERASIGEEEPPPPTETR
jgi:hypothetical protein